MTGPKPKPAMPRIACAPADVTPAAVDSEPVACDRSRSAPRAAVRDSPAAAYELAAGREGGGWWEKRPAAA